MELKNAKVLVLGGWGLVGMAVCRQLLRRQPREIVIHSLRREEAEDACQRLAARAGDTVLTPAYGDLFGVVGEASRREQVLAQVLPMRDEDLPRFALYRLLTETRPEIVVDCVNTATGIAYRDLFQASQRLATELGDDPVPAASVEELLEALYVPRLLRHVQVIYRGMQQAATRVYVKVGTSGTGGMGLNIPYTHSEESPSRVLLSKSALAGAHSMLLWLMARTPGAPITKEIKPAAAIAWKRIGRGPIHRRGRPLRLVRPHPVPLGKTFSSHDPGAAEELDEVLDTVYIDTGENGIFSLEEFAVLTTSEQMEFVTPEEIAQHLVFEIEGGNTGHDIVNALDNAVLGPSYRAGLMRHWALERMNELEKEAGVRSVAFEMLGPPHLTKLLFEAHLLRLGFRSMLAVRNASPQEVQDRLVQLLKEQPRVAGEIAAVGIPILLPSGELLRGPSVIVPGDAEREPVTSEKLEDWVRAGWVDLRLPNCSLWVERFRRIYDEFESISEEEETSSQHLRSRRFWHDERTIQPGKIVGWIFSEEEQGARIKD